MIVGKGATMHLNRSGQNKALLNILASVPELHQEMFSVIRNYAAYKKQFGANYLNQAIAPSLSNMNNLIYFMTGQGEQPDELSMRRYKRGIATRQGEKALTNYDEHFVDGVPTRDTKGSNAYYREIGNFVKKAMVISLGNMRQRMSPEEYAEIENKFNGVKGLFLYLTKNNHEQYSVAKTNGGNQIRPEEKNKWLLVNEVAQIMKAHNMEEVGDAEKQLVADTLNSRGAKRKAQKPFNRLNVDRFIQEVLKVMEGTFNGENRTRTLVETAEMIEQKSYIIDQIYKTGKTNKPVEEMFDIRRDPVTGDFKSYGGYSSSHASHAYLSELVEVTSESSHSEDDSSVKDPRTRAYLPRFDLETGESLYGDTPILFRGAHGDNLESDTLRQWLAGQTPEQRMGFFNNQSALVEIIQERLTVGHMNDLSQMFFLQQQADGEVNDAVLEQGVEQEVGDAPDRPVEDGDDDDGIDWGFGGDDGEEDEGMDLLQQMRMRRQPPPDAGAEDFPIDDNGEEGRDEEEEGLGRDAGNYFLSTLNSLVKISEELDKEGKTKDSIEILKLAQKFSNRLKRG
jgi:hypothetical protein